MWKRTLVLSVCFFGWSYGISDGNITNLCPSANLIAPCTCSFPSYEVECKDIIANEYILTKVVDAFKGIEHQFSQFRLLNSRLEYLPKEIFEVENFFELYVENVQLEQLFDDPPTSSGAYETVRFVNLYVIGGIAWEAFSRMPHLKTLHMNGFPVPVVGEEFKTSVPHQLEEIEILNARTRRLGFRVFEDFVNLKLVMFHRCRLEKTWQLNREKFPVPFNVEVMYFAYVQLTFIPVDLFTEMPKLKYISLEGNQLATVPETAFGGQFKQIKMLLLGGNPLKCDCSLKWIVRRKPQWFDGTCESPKSMHGKELGRLTEQDFIC